MQNLWQDFAALAVVVVAAIYLGRRLWPARSAAGGSNCGGGCTGCSTSGDVANAAGADDAKSTIIPIDQLPLKSRAINADRDS